MDGMHPASFQANRSEAQQLFLTLLDLGVICKAIGAHSNALRVLLDFLEMHSYDWVSEKKPVCLGVSCEL